MKQWQPARGLKQDHDSAGAVMRVHKGDCDPSHLDGAVQGQDVKPPHWHLEALVHQSRSDGRAIDHACNTKRHLVSLARVTDGGVDKRHPVSLAVY